MDIKDLVPQRAPFLFIDGVEKHNERAITTHFTFKPELDFFQGHFPSNPVVPGVILNEHCFQSAAAFMSLKNKSEQAQGLTVVSRIQNAKFKNLVKPQDKITSETELIEEIANAAFFKSKITNQENKKVLFIEFSVALVKG